MRYVFIVAVFLSQSLFAADFCFQGAEMVSCQYMPQINEEPQVPQIETGIPDFAQ